MLPSTIPASRIPSVSHLWDTFPPQARHALVSLWTDLLGRQVQAQRHTRALGGGGDLSNPSRPIVARRTR